MLGHEDVNSSVIRAVSSERLEAILKYGLIVNPEDANDPMLLHAAVEKGYSKIIEDLLKYGADVNTILDSTFGGFMPLHTAAKNKQLDVAELLISHKADINAQDKTGKTPIFYAIANADLKFTELLLTYGANVKDNPELLNTAVANKCIKIIEALLQHDVDINASDSYGQTALHFTVVNVPADLLGYCTNRGPDITSRGEIAQLLLSKGANVNSETNDGATTLHMAIEKGYTKVVEALLKYNANVDSVVKPYISPFLHHLVALHGEAILKMPKNEFTPLHFAIQYSNKEVVKLLLEYGAKVDFENGTDITPLHVGVESGHQSTIETILNYGADINCRDKYGRTALHIASYKGCRQIVENLLEYGADINITSRDDRTPRDHAVAGLKTYDKESEVHDSLYVFCYSETFEALTRHIVKLRAANLYVSEKNLRSVIGNSDMNDFRDKCEEEITDMKNEKINNANISFYDILSKNTSSLAIYMRNENIVQVLKADDYKTKFPTYASMIESHFRKSMERKELLEQENNIFHFFFPELPYNCSEEIFSYLSDKDLKIVIDACKPLGISDPDTNINDAAITSNVSQVQYA